MSFDYVSLKEEYLAATQATAWFDLPGRTQLELRGADRQKFLHNFCTNEVRNLRPGQSCEAFVTTVQGKILAHIWVFASADCLWIDAVPGYEDLLFKHLDKYLISEDVQFERRSTEFHEIFVTGPSASEKLQQLGLPAEILKVHQHLAAEAWETPVSIRRLDWFNSAGFLIQFAEVHLELVRARLMSAGIPEGSPAVFESLRIMAGLPRHGQDITADNLAQEAGRTDLVINFNKGCYLGQEPIARIDAMGHVNQELRGLRLAGTVLPAVGSKVIMPHEVREAGTLTSIGWDWSANCPVGLALIRRNYLSPGKQLAIPLGDEEIPAVVFWRT